MSSTETEWGEERRLELSIHHALEHVSMRYELLEGKDRFALLQEFLEWTVVDDIDDLDIQWIKDVKEW